MEVLMPLLIIVIIIGALLGGKSFGGTVRKGCGFIILLVIIFVVLGVFVNSQNNSKKTPENKEVISVGNNSAYFIVKENCQTFIKPNIESNVSGNLETGKEFFVEAINKFNYFYEITDQNGKKVFVRKKCLKRR